MLSLWLLANLLFFVKFHRYPVAEFPDNLRGSVCLTVLPLSDHGYLRDSIDKMFALDQSVDLLRKLTGGFGAESDFNGLNCPAYPKQSRASEGVTGFPIGECMRRFS